jgi:uncharacterized protein (TIGR03437 family)
MPKLWRASLVLCLLVAAPSLSSAQCSFSLSPNTASFSAAGGNGLVTIAASDPSCARTATSGVPWITISFGSPGTGSGTVGYTVSANTSPSARTGTLSIAGQIFTVTQTAAVCNFSLDSNAGTYSPAGESGSFNVFTNCTWTATTAASWINLTASSGTANGPVTFTVAPNTSSTQRSGSITVGSVAYTVTQGGATCSFVLTPSSANISFNGGTGSFNFTSSGCAWTVSLSSQATWLNVTSPTSGLGDGAVNFTAASNTSGAARTATVSVGSQNFTVSQAAQCTLTLSPTSASFAASGGTGSTTITASGTSCDRSATVDSAWIGITAGATGTGNGTLSYTVAVNSTSNLRNGTIIIGGQPFYVAELPSTCSYSLAPVSSAVPIGGAVGTFSVVTPSTCSWTAVSNNADWLVISGSSSGTGNGNVNFTAAGNGTGQPRNGTIAVGTINYNVYQAGAACQVHLTPASATANGSGDTGSITIDASNGCFWQAAVTVPWITIPASGSSGSGAGSLSWSAAPNTANTSRQGAITIGDQIFNLTESGNSCTITLDSTSLAVPSNGGTGSVSVTTLCSWTAVSNAAWIELTGTANGSGNGTLSFTVTANNGASSRTGVVNIGGQMFTVTQPGAGCNLTISPSSGALPARGGSGTFNVSGNAGCPWQPQSSDSWLVVNFSSVSGSGVVNYSAVPNVGSAPRSAAISVSSQTVQVTQAGAVITLSTAGVANAATFAAGPVAPGEIITVFGSGFGPPQLVTAQLTADGTAITTLLSGTNVLFDGVPAPMLYTGDGQLSCIVPFSVSGKSSTTLQVQYYGLLSPPVTLPVASSSPGIFTVNQKGTGQGALLNQDLKPNTTANPAAKNSIVVLYATGGGVTNPAVADGKLVPGTPPLPRLTLPVSVKIGGIDAPVTYSGSAPGLVNGAVQINARVPANVASGAVPVVVTIGAATSQSGVTLSVR